VVDARIGISGWTYPPWRGVFFPKGLPHRRELAYASERLNSIELNATFYALQRPSSYRTWAAETPDDFVFSIKGGRFITHLKKLRDVDGALANFFASGPLVLGAKLGPILWQLPPTFGYDAERLADFFSRLPRSTGEAAYLARRHDDRLKDRSFTNAVLDRPLRHALEVRHGSFTTPDFLDLLRQHQVAAVVADTAGKWPLLDAVTADFVYARLHGDKELYESGYTPQALDVWAERARQWLEDGRDVFMYFDNDVKVRAPFDAMALSARLSVPQSARALP
jgi:uncharacterized protein YecE (DUF72 family)